MKKQITLASYRDRILRVVEHLWQHPRKHTDLNSLAEVAHLSPYHFHRIYRELMHETVNQTARRLRLHRGANLLIRTDDPVETIAHTLDYSGAEAFTRAFSAAYGQPPAGFRQSRQAASNYPLTLPDFKESAMNYPIEILELPKMTLGGLAHKGDYMSIGATFDKLFLIAETKQLVDDSTRSFGIYYDDPTSKPTADLNSHACITLSPEQAKAAGLESLTIGGGKFVVLTHTGPYAELEKGYEWFYGQWLPHSGHEPADTPPFEEYVNDPHQVAPSELITRIHLPLAES